MSEAFAPTPTPATRPYWEAAKRGELVMQRSRSTGQYFFYPRAFVPGRLDDEFEWVRVSGRGTLISYIINNRPAPGFEKESPVIALVRLAEGPRLMTNIVDVEPMPENLRIGASVEVRFRARGELALPVFVIASEGEEDR